LKDQEDEFARDIYRLSQEVIFDLTMFEEIVDKIRSCVAEVKLNFVVLCVISSKELQPVL